MTPFGTLADGRTVHALTLAAGDLAVSLLTLGATIRDVRLAGVAHGLTLGSDDPDDYISGRLTWFGSLVGPVANRIAGARAAIAGQEYRFEANQNRDTLHSGAASTCHKLWTVAEHGPAHAVLTCDLPDGEGGFPGNRQVTARFALTGSATLTQTVTTTTDAATWVNLTNHSYWNLDGSGNWAGHRLRIAADAYLMVDARLIPQGPPCPVEGSAFDLRQGRAIVPGEPPIDHNFCLSHAATPLRDVLWLTGRDGVAMTLATTEPGVQVYDGRDARLPGGDAYQGLAIEAQGWPDAPNRPDFPSILLGAGQARVQVTQWRFARPD